MQKKQKRPQKKINKEKADSLRRKIKQANHQPDSTSNKGRRIKSTKLEMKNPRVGRRKKLIKIKAEINEKETKKTIPKISKAKSQFFEKINKINKPLARFIKKKGRRIKLTKSKMKMEKSQQTTQKYKGS